MPLQLKCVSIRFAAELLCRVQSHGTGDCSKWRRGRNHCFSCHQKHVS